LVGRVASLLGAPRVIAFGLLAVALGLYYGFHTSLPNTSTWGDVAFLSFVLIPAVLALVYLGAAAARRTRARADRRSRSRSRSWR
jgi:hypothetical protein